MDENSYFLYVLSEITASFDVSGKEIFKCFEENLSWKANESADQAHLFNFVFICQIPFYLSRYYFFYVVTKYSITGGTFYLFIGPPSFRKTLLVYTDFDSCRRG